MATTPIHFSRNRLRRALGALGIALAGLLVAQPAAAQQGGTLMPPGQGGTQPAQTQQQLQDITAAPQPKLPKDYPVWVGYLVVFLMVAAIMGASLMPSKRSHQD